MVSDLLAGLNPEQERAVTLAQGSALILAGAGSGKTRVLTTRIAWLLQHGHVGPQGILAVTFTNKAAREMHTRLSAMLPLSTHSLWIGTFHGVCNRFLRTHHRDAGLPATFQILDMQDQLAVIKRLLKQLQLSDETFPPRQVQGFINGNKEAGLRADKLAAPNPFLSRMVDIYREYDAQCRREGVLDFAELLLRSFEMLSANAALRAHYQERFRYLLVDEFQDTNRLQYAWLRLLAGESATLFAVGDDDQSIYSFRGAEVGNMRQLLSDYGVQEPIRLEQNYRSSGAILDAANALIANNKGRLGKKLWTDAGAGELIRVFQALSDGEEAAFIVDEVRALVREGRALSDIALLYRANAQSRVLEHALFQGQVPYRVYGGLRFFERQEIKHALAYLRLVAHPDDDNALLRVINIPARGIGLRTVEALQARALAQGSSLWQAACGGGNGRSAGNVTQFIALIDSLRADAERLDFAGLISQIIDASGLRAFYQAEKDGGDRLENLDELINAAYGFRPEDPANSVVEFLTHASLEAGDHQAETGEAALHLMTVHAAKGLEFDAVFVVGLEEGLFPHENALNDSNGLEEERRLMYVALTRARAQLYLTHAQSRMLHGQTRYPMASRFLQEIPETLCKSVSVNKRQNTVPASVTRAPSAGSRVAAQGAGFRIGQNVAHPKFGSGVIVNAEGSGVEVRVEVNFAAAGCKWLDLRYAKLSVA